MHQNINHILLLQNIIKVRLIEEATEAGINWYNIAKDIIIPSLSVLATIILGTIIAVSLKQKEEKAKIKALLIDNYMLYLNKKMAFFNYEVSNFTYQIFKNIYINYRGYFPDNANWHMPMGLIQNRRDKLQSAFPLLVSPPTKRLMLKVFSVIS